MTKRVRLSNGQKNYALLKFLIPLFVVIAGIILFFYSDIFQIKQIELTGRTAASTKEVEKILEPLFNQNKNIFLFDRTKASRLILEKIPYIASVEILRKLPNTLRIVVTDRRPALIWKSGVHKYILDKEGVAFREASKEKYLTIEDTMNVSVKIGQKIVDARFVSFVLRLDNFFYKTLEIKPKTYKVSELIKFLTVETENNFYILFNTEEDPLQELDYLKKLFKQVDPDDLSYIDMRLKDWIYYCPLFAECAKTSVSSLQPVEDSAEESNIIPKKKDE